MLGVGGGEQGTGGGGGVLEWSEEVVKEQSK